MLVIKRIELMSFDDGAEIMILNDQDRIGRLEDCERADHTGKVLDMREYVGEGDDVGRAVRMHEL